MGIKYFDNFVPAVTQVKGKLYIRLFLASDRLDGMRKLVHDLNNVEADLMNAATEYSVSLLKV